MTAPEGSPEIGPPGMSVSRRGDPCFDLHLRKCRWRVLLCRLPALMWVRGSVLGEARVKGLEATRTDGPVGSAVSKPSNRRSRPCASLLRSAVC